MPDGKKAEWEQDIQKILKSNRIAEMTFHVPIVDKDMEYITAKAMAEALEDYQHFPIINEFHKERPVGVAEKIWQTQEDEFQALIRIREDPSVNDVWDKIKKGEYNQVSIAGRRTEYSSECNLHQSQRSKERPCRTTGLRLDSISVCDEAARNDNTSLAIVKAGLEDPGAFVYTTTLVLTQVEDTLIKAETTDSSLIHPVTDGTKLRPKTAGDKMKKCNDKSPVKKGDEEEIDEKEEKKEAMKEEADKEEKAEEHEISEKEEKEEEKKAESGSSLADDIAEIKAILKQLVSSDKKVHESMKADETKEPIEEKKVEKAEIPAVPPAVVETITKAEMEQDFKKAIDIAIAPVLTEIETLKKANLDLAAKLEAYALETIEKSGIRLMPNVDSEGKPVLGNAGAVALQMQGKVKS